MNNQEFVAFNILSQAIQIMLLEILLFDPSWPKQLWSSKMPTHVQVEYSIFPSLCFININNHLEENASQKHVYLKLKKIKVFEK